MRGFAKTGESLDLALGLALARLVFPLARGSFRSRRIRESHATSREAATELSSPLRRLVPWLRGPHGLHRQRQLRAPETGPAVGVVRIVARRCVLAQTHASRGARAETAT